MSATFDSANRMTGISLSMAGATKTYALSYDSNGNLTQKQNTTAPIDKTTYAWDTSNRLTQLTQTGATAANSNNDRIDASFSYDAFGRRIQSTIAKGGQAANTVQYLYEGQQALGEIRNGQLINRILTGLSLDETIARIAINSSGQKDAANSRIFMTDALNSVIAQLADDNNASIQNSYGYSPYGEATTIGPDGTNNSIQYTSRENDQTGLYFYRARYLDPVLKIFVSEDPIGLRGGMNVRAYVMGNPIRYSDPLGLQAISGGAAGAGGLGGLGAFGGAGGGSKGTYDPKTDTFGPASNLPNISYPPPKIDPLEGTRPEVQIPTLDPKVPKGPGKPNDPDSGGACRKMFEACIQAAASKMCPAPLRTPAIALCTATAIICFATLGD